MILLHNYTKSHDTQTGYNPICGFRSVGWASLPPKNLTNQNGGAYATLQKRLCRLLDCHDFASAKSHNDKKFKINHFLAIITDIFRKKDFENLKH